jgi:hypothetical protein
METGLIIFCVIGILMFIAYIFFIIKTSHDDQKAKKLEKLSKNGKA